MIQSEKQFNTKSTTDAFDEIYTNYDLSVNEEYSASNGYPFDYPIRWLNDPSMNKRIAVRRLDCIPSTHSFRLKLHAAVDETYIDDQGQEQYQAEYDFPAVTIDITEYDNLTKVLNFICTNFKYDIGGKSGSLTYLYDNDKNVLTLLFKNSENDPVPFYFHDDNEGDDIRDFLAFLNQEDLDSKYQVCTESSMIKEFEEVWNRDRLYFHASFSTSKRRFIGKRGDFYQTLTLLYPPPTNESTFYIRFSSNGIKNILIRYCEFDIQFCFIVNYQKSNIL